MDELKKICSDWSSGLFSTRQAWIVRHYDFLNEFRRIHGWDVLVSLINSYTNMNTDKKNFTKSMYKARSKAELSPESKKPIRNTVAPEKIEKIEMGENDFKDHPDFRKYYSLCFGNERLTNQIMTNGIALDDLKELIRKKNYTNAVALSYHFNTKKYEI